MLGILGGLAGVPRLSAGPDHAVYSLTKRQEFEIETQLPGKADAVEVDRPGVALVECAIHPKTKVSVYVAR
jgi:hypothetical protein